MMRPSSANAVIEGLQSCIEKETEEKKYQRTRSSGNFAGMPTRFHVSWNHVFSSFPIQVLGYKILQVHYPVVPYFKLQYIVFVVQHGQMDVFLNTFLIGIIRQLLISPIPSDDGILPGIIVKLTMRPSSLSTLKVLLGFNIPGTSGFGHIMT